MNTTERLKHASEVRGWLADGKTIQKERAGFWEDTRIDPEYIGASIIADGWRYRIKPEPVEFDGVVATDALWNLRPFVVLDSSFKWGDRVRVTKLEEDQSSTSPR